MTAITFDTLKFVKTLKAAGFEERQAEALAEAQVDVFEKNLEELATKQDLKELELRVTNEMKEQELRLTLRFGGMLAVAVAVIVMLGKVF